MSKFVIACPVCHQYVQASTGLFASRRVRCACGNIIDVKTERLPAASARPAAIRSFSIRPTGWMPAARCASRR